MKKGKNDSFKLWLEFEEFDLENDWDPENEFFNMKIVHDGSEFRLNVWSYGFAIETLRNPDDHDLDFMCSPDLLVRTCTREHMERVVAKLIEDGMLDPFWK